MSAYLDTSVLAAYYLPEARSEKVEKTLLRFERPSISLLVDIEFASALARRVRMRELTVEGAREAAADFRADKAAGRYRLAEIQDAHYIQARAWIESHRAPLRSLDAIHLAIAHGMSLPIVTADRRLSSAARALGLKSNLIF